MGQGVAQRVGLAVGVKTCDRQQLGCRGNFQVGGIGGQLDRVAACRSDVIHMGRSGGRDPAARKSGHSVRRHCEGDVAGGIAAKGQHARVVGYCEGGCWTRFRCWRNRGIHNRLQLGGCGHVGLVCHVAEDALQGAQAAGVGPQHFGVVLRYLDLVGQQPGHAQEGICWVVAGHGGVGLEGRQVAEYVVDHLAARQACAQGVNDLLGRQLFGCRRGAVFDDVLHQPGGKVFRAQALGVSGEKLRLGGEDLDDLQRGHARFDRLSHLAPVCGARCGAKGHREELVHLGLLACVKQQGADQLLQLGGRGHVGLVRHVVDDALQGAQAVGVGPQHFGVVLRHLDLVGQQLGHAQEGICWVVAGLGRVGLAGCQVAEYVVDHLAARQASAQGVGDLVGRQLFGCRRGAVFDDVLHQPGGKGFRTQALGVGGEKLRLGGEDLDDPQCGHARFDRCLQFALVCGARCGAKGHREKLVHLGLAACVESSHEQPFLNWIDQTASGEWSISR